MLLLSGAQVRLTNNVRTVGRETAWPPVAGRIRISRISPRCSVSGQTMMANHRPSGE